MEALARPSVAAEVSRPTGPAAIATSAPSLKLLPPVKARSPCSLVMTSTSPTDCTPIWKPIEAPDIPIKAGPVHLPLDWRRNTTPSPVCPPMPNPAFVTAGKMATPLPDFITSASASASCSLAILLIRSVESRMRLICAVSAKAACAAPATRSAISAKMVIFLLTFIPFPPFVVSLFLLYYYFII